MGGSGSAYVWVEGTSEEQDCHWILQGLDCPAQSLGSQLPPCQTFQDGNKESWREIVSPLVEP